MQIESIIKRKNSKIEMGDGTVYVFRPLNGAPFTSPHVAEVTKKSHIQRLLSITEGYRAYVANEDDDDDDDDDEDDTPEVVIEQPTKRGVSTPKAVQEPAPKNAEEAGDGADSAASAGNGTAPAEEEAPPADEQAEPAAADATEDADTAKAALVAQLTEELGELNDEDLAENYKTIFGRAPNKTWPRTTVVDRLIGAATTPGATVEQKGE